MDVILDTNVYKGDFRMQNAQFQELFKYLERTGASIVLPSVVHMEMIKEYRQAISQTLNELRKAWGGLQGRAVREVGEFSPPIVIDDEVSAFEELLVRPAPKIKGIIYDDYSGVEVREVARRGVERVRPANDSGEELRDVILWLMVLDYARKHAEGVAFISSDKTFRGDGELLHPTLASEISTFGVMVRFHASISGYITSHSLETEKLAEQEFQPLVDVGAVNKEVASALEQRASLWGAVQQFVIDSLHLAKGQRYKVGDKAFYLEAVLRASARVKLREYLGVFQPFANNAIVAPTWEASPAAPGRKPARRPLPGHLPRQGILISPRTGWTRLGRLTRRRSPYTKSLGSDILDGSSARPHGLTVC